MTFTLDWCECILQVLVAQIKKAIADVQSGNPVNYAVGKVDLVIRTYCNCFLLTIDILSFLHFLLKQLQLPLDLSKIQGPPVLFEITFYSMSEESVSQKCKLMFLPVLFDKKLGF